jgi:carbon storage regulator CsrA
MLVLKRRHKQRILIGDDIVITVFTKSKYDKSGTVISNVSVGIDAPDNVVILREELKNGKRCQKSKPITYFRTE